MYQLLSGKALRGRSLGVRIYRPQEEKPSGGYACSLTKLGNGALKPRIGENAPGEEKH